MPKLRLEVELEYDDSFIGETPDADETAWFLDEIIKHPDGLILHSNEIGDEIGIVHVLSIHAIE